jgi:1-acyl-sn-glycerol-3-phosphate acyltransferase
MESNTEDRMISDAVAQIYTDWIFLWWSAYTAQMHGHFFIILKESLQYIPLLGPGMMFFSFLFLSRKWETDMPRMQHRLSKLKSKHHGPLSGTSDLDPMWLLLFPEGTNISKNGRAGSKKWADKIGVEDLKHTLLPRSRGLLFCLTELKGTVDWLYDCTISYDGIP